jgi:hypothetical protein
VTLALSTALRWLGGAAALATVLCAWAYNLTLKATVLSWLPYAIAFGMLPAVATLSASPARRRHACVITPAVAARGTAESGIRRLVPHKVSDAPEAGVAGPRPGNFFLAAAF